MSDTDRQDDLLLCLTVVQENIASVDSLTTVLQKWPAQPTSSLDNLLLEQGIITVEQKEFLNHQIKSKRAGAEAEATSAWRTLPQSLQNALTDPPSSPLNDPKTVEPTRDHTSPQPAPIVGGKNDERFRVVSPYAQGGLGEISVAHDMQLGRMVALKQIKARWADDADARSRFLLEAQITGRLEHPGIVPVYALGCDASGRPYYAMRFIEGETLQEVVKQFHNKYGHKKHGQAKNRSAQDSHGERLLELRKLLGRLIDVCQAIDYAHNRGILHRDLKPANILLGKYGETLVVDWGLAKVIGGNKLPTLPFQEIAAAGGHAATVMGTAIGTPAYMSPEQAAGRSNELSPQTDVYSLGVTLYHILTGRLPYEQESVSRVLEEIKNAPITPPRAHCAWLPRTLEAICLKAMAPQPADRYPSTAALADDLERWLADEPVAAREAGLLERLRRWLRHRRG
ncbi:MAG: serine/threonine-protein kinase [Bythopirellula sp.]|nr:serine/threonine-protein kinase [Bythopirellula sp.]